MLRKKHENKTCVILYQNKKYLCYDTESSIRLSGGGQNHLILFRFPKNLIKSEAGLLHSHGCGTSVFFPPQISQKIIALLFFILFISWESSSAQLISKFFQKLNVFL